MIAHPISRRRALHKLGAGSLAVAPFLQGFAARAANPSDTIPKRFVFIVRANGILPTEIQPTTLPGLVVPRGAPLRQKKFIEHDLAEHELSKGLVALEPFKDRLSIFQGLSGRMANSDHRSKDGALGAYRSGTAPPILPTVDGVLASGLDSPFPHIGFAMAQSGPQVVYPSLFAAGPGKPLPCYADPLVAYGDLFGSVVSDEKLRAAVQVDKNILDFMAGDVATFQKTLPLHEKEKLDHYLDGFEALRVRSKRLAAMEHELKNAAPDLTVKFGSEIETERLDAHFELATSALVGGLTQVVAICADHLGMRLTGLGLGTKTVHHIGHMIEGQEGGEAGGGQDFANGLGEFATRELIMDYHMKNIAKMAAKLKSVPEGDGTMLDNTVIVYLSDHGEKHHSNCYEWPMVALGNVDGAFKAGHYIHVPGWGEPGHRTIASLYKSLLHGAGLPSDNFGQPDRTLPGSIDQESPLIEWIA